jgi:hypothetical protein
VSAIDGSWDDTDFGDVRDVEPPMRFGFSSTPRKPCNTLLAPLCVELLEPGWLVEIEAVAAAA